MYRLFILVVGAALIGCAPTPPPLPPVIAWTALNQPLPAEPAAAQPTVPAGITQ